MFPRQDPTAFSNRPPSQLVLVPAPLSGGELLDVLLLWEESECVLVPIPESILQELSPFASELAGVSAPEFGLGSLLCPLSESENRWNEFSEEPEVTRGLSVSEVPSSPS